MQDEYELDEGISLGTIFKVGFGRKLLFLIVTLAVAVVMFLVIVLFYNKGKVNYESTFNYNMSTTQKDKYIDGSSYNVNSIISSTNLLNIKEKDADFKNIDIDKLIETNSISLTKSVKEYNNTELKAETVYTLKVLKRYFPNDKVAAKFIKAVAETPIDKTNSLANSLTYDGNLVAYTVADSYETKISLLNIQKEFLDASYEALIELYGDIYIDNRSLTSYQKDIDDYFLVNQIEALTSQVALNGYVLNFDKHVNDLNIQKEHLNTQIAKNNQAISNIEAEIERIIEKLDGTTISTTSLGLDAFNTELAKLNLENASYQNELEIVQKKIDLNGGADKTTFETTLKTYYDALNSFTKNYKEVSKKAYSSNETISYTSSSAIKTSGGLSSVIAVVIGLVLGIIIAFIVNLIVDREKLSPDYVWPSKKANKEAKELENKEE